MVHKMSIGCSIAHALNHKLFWISVGVLSDVDEIRVIKHLFTVYTNTKIYAYNEIMLLVYELLNLFSGASRTMLGKMMQCLKNVEQVTLLFRLMRLTR